MTLSHPRSGIWSWPAKCSSTSVLGDRPDALSPCSPPPAQTRQKASDPIPFDVGSTTVNAIADDTAASIAFPPSQSMRSPACAASGCEVATTFRASTGIRCEV